MYTVPSQHNMFSVPSQHSMLAAAAGTNSPMKLVEGEFTDINVFVQDFVKEMMQQMQTLHSVDEIHRWASSTLPVFQTQHNKKVGDLKDRVLGMMSSSSPSLGLPPSNPNQGGWPVGFETGSPRSNRLQSIDTLASQQSRLGSMRLLGVGAHILDESVAGDEAHNNASNSNSNSNANTGATQVMSPKSISRPGSFTNRYGSFARKNMNGIDVPMLKDEASGAVVDALNDAYSMGSRGSWRRRAPGSTVSASQATAVNNMNDIKRKAYLSFVRLEGMPALNIEADAKELRSRFSRPSNRHTAVFRQLGDLESLLDECNIPRIHDINSLEFNVFEEYQKYGDNAFTIVVMNVLLKYTFVTTFHFRIANLLTFVKTVQSFYRPENPFHNALHAADVIQTTHLYLCQRDVKENFSDVELMALLFGAMCIDVGHLGVNNEFLMKVQHPLAMLYSDSSPMEAMSCALTFCILDDPDCNFLHDSVVWDREKENDFRALLTDLILRSDTREHTSLCNEVDEILARGNIAEEAVPNLLCAVLHAADISYMCKPRHIYLEWAFRFVAENYRQGDAEAEYASMYREAHPDVPVDAETRWLKVSQLCNRSAMSTTELQQNIMEHILLPFVTLLQHFLPSVWVERLEANFRYLKEDEEEKTIVLQNGVQEQLFKKGIATHWCDVPANSGKNFLQVVRSWIATELPDDNCDHPSKFACDSLNGIPDQNSNSAQSTDGTNTNDDKPFSSSTGGGGLHVAPGEYLKVKPDQKKRLSVSSSSGLPNSASPSATSGLNAVHVLTSEMLKHMHTILNAGIPGSWDASREIAIFAQEWIKLLKHLESQDNGPALLSTLVSSQLRSLAAGSSEEEESISIIETLRDQSSPFAHFRPGKMSTSTGHLPSSGASESTGRRESVNDIVSSNSPFSCSVLLTQMWWLVLGMVSENVRHCASDERELRTPNDGPLNGGCVSDDDLSVSQKDSRSPHLPMGLPPVAHHGHRLNSLPTAYVATQEVASTAAPLVGGGDAQHVLAPTPPVEPAPQQSALREIMQSTRRSSAGMPPQHNSGDDGPTTSAQSAADPSPVKYVLAKRNSVTPKK